MEYFIGPWLFQEGMNEEHINVENTDEIREPPENIGIIRKIWGKQQRN